MSSLSKTMLERVRKECLALPGTSERESHGAPTFFVDDKKSFLTFSDNHHGDGRLAIVCAAPEGAQGMLVEAAPDRYYLPPYVARLGWIGMRLDRDAAWGEVASVIRDAYLTRAPKKRVAELQGTTATTKRAKK